MVLPKETGWSPKEKRLGWWRPREVSGPTRLSHSRGRCHSAAKVSASRTDWITRPRGEGLGLDVDWRLKVFCPAFLQKSGRGPGAEPWPRAAARGTPLVLTKRRRGSKGGTLAGGPPFAGGLRRPQPLRHRGAGGELRKGSSRTPTPTGWLQMWGLARMSYAVRVYGVAFAFVSQKPRRGRRPRRPAFQTKTPHRGVFTTSAARSGHLSGRTRAP